MEEGEARSVFILVEFACGPCEAGLYEIKIQQGGEVMRPKILEPEFKFVLPKFCWFEGARLHNSSKLHLVLNKGLLPRHNLPADDKLGSYRGQIYDTETRSLETFEPPLAPKPVSYLMSAYGRLYNLASPQCFRVMPKVLFERYDSKTDSWESLTHFAYSRERSKMEIAGYAVCHGCILVSTCNFRFEFMVFHIDSNTWHQVDISRKEAYYSAFRGRAVVVGNSIYALSIQRGKVIAFSLKMKIGNDGRITYSLEEPFFLPGLESRVEDITESGLISRPTEYLVHLGKLEFCLLQTISTHLEEPQEMFITTFEIVCDDETMHIKTLDSSVCDFHIGHYGTLCICFSFMPKCEDFEPEEEESFRLAHKKGRAKKNNALDGFISMIKSSKRVKWPPKYELRRLAAAFHPLPVCVQVMAFVFVVYFLYKQISIY
ncbi:hypothetical protein PS2_038712 [Malus domestica]